jgi:anti-sigma regulatory factor (Ser/Thr protein kinase)
MDSISDDYEPNLDAPHDSRVLVRDFLIRHGAGNLVFVGGLLLSELVSNVVRHAQSTIEIALTWDHDTLRAEVHDGSSILPAVADLADTDGGYGLRIVDALAQDWGARQLEHGKAVWFTLHHGDQQPTAP